ncbi:MAG TPA: hypothetical protein PLO37_23445 [Candidatus Hydrogenedentes bacterium]|nr:hypothetical protein [Candidatus Hydrogenedentota bacterium]
MLKTKQTRAKQERVIEAVRLGMEGDAALEFLHENGYAMTPAGIARHLRVMGGRGHIQELIAEGKSNAEILEETFPDEDLSGVAVAPPSQGELFDAAEVLPSAEHSGPTDAPLYPTTKLTIHVPADLYEAIRLASKAEGKTHNQLIVDILTTALSRLPDLTDQ